jgi:glycosyltransferase involved in cell wall biosynthesis
VGLELHAFNATLASFSSRHVSCPQTALLRTPRTARQRISPRLTRHVDDEQRTRAAVGGLRDMRIVFIHQNYPAQFGQLAQWLAQQHQWEVTFVTERSVEPPSHLRVIRYQPRGGATRQTHFCSRTFENCVWRAHAVYDALAAVPEVTPDLIVGHSGFGSTVFLRELYACPLINYFEYFYRPRHSDMDFRPEFAPTLLERLRAYTRNAMILLDLHYCTTGYCPTEWQKGLFPVEYQPKLRVIFDGIDTDFWRPRSNEHGRQGLPLPLEVPVVTYVSRGFEAMRGFDIFMEVSQRIARAIPTVRFVCVGSERVCYGGDLRFTGGKSFFRHVLERGQHDLTRYTFPGWIAPQELARVLSRSNLHIYLTVPFVLSWSLLNAMACGCLVLASDTQPVRELIQHGKNGLLAPFASIDTLTELAVEALRYPERFEHLREQARRTVLERYSAAVTYPKLKAFFEEIATGSAHGAGSP